MQQGLSRAQESSVLVPLLSQAFAAWPWPVTSPLFFPPALGPAYVAPKIWGQGLSCYVNPVLSSALCQPCLGPIGTPAHNEISSNSNTNALKGPKRDRLSHWYTCDMDVIRWEILPLQSTFSSANAWWNMCTMVRSKWCGQNEQQKQLSSLNIF